MARFLQKDILSGLLGLLFSAVILFSAQNLAFMQGFRVGPGYLPKIVACLIGAVSLVMILRGLLAESEPAESVSWRPLILILAAVGTFAALVSHLGLLVASVSAVILSSLADSPVSWREAVPLAIILPAVAAMIFVLLLGLPLRLLP